MIIEMVESCKINFIANSKCLEFSVSGSTETETLTNRCWMLLPFVVGFDETKDIAQMGHYYQNTDELRDKVKRLVTHLKDLNPRIFQMYDYFDKQLKRDEWFYLCVDEELTREQRDEILSYLASIDATEEERKEIAKSHEILQRLREVYDIQIYNESTNVNIGEPEKTKRVCRYCHRSMPEVTFKDTAHTISESLGEQND